MIKRYHTCYLCASSKTPLFRLPTSRVRRRAWATVCNINSSALKRRNTRICKEHFRQEDFYSPGGNAKLIRIKSDACPSLKLTKDDNIKKPEQSSQSTSSTNDSCRQNGDLKISDEKMCIFQIVETKFDFKKDGNEEPSVLGRFMWTVVGNNCVPCLLTTDGMKFVSMRMIKHQILSQFLLQFNFDVFECVAIDHFRITSSMMKLLNEINSRHCDFAFGRELFSMGETMMRFDDFVEFHQFVVTCYNKLLSMKPLPSKSKCGFLRINGSTVLSYAVKNGQKYVPLFYFEGETEGLKANAIRLEKWDMAYLKFCCKVQGLKNSLFESKEWLVISLQHVKSYLPKCSKFEEHWPSKIENNGNNSLRLTSRAPCPTVNDAKVKTVLAQLLRENQKMNTTTVQVSNRSLSKKSDELSKIILSRGVEASHLTSAENGPSQNSSALHTKNEIIDPLSRPLSPKLIRPSSVEETLVSETDGRSCAEIKILSDFLKNKNDAYPFKMRKLHFKNTVIPAVNLTPFHEMTFAVTLYDVCKLFFPKMGTKTLKEALVSALKCTLYRANTIQMELLQKVHEHPLDEDDFLLLELTDFTKFYQHLTFIHSRYQKRVVQSNTYNQKIQNNAKRHKSAENKLRSDESCKSSSQTCDLDNDNTVISTIMLNTTV